MQQNDLQTLFDLESYQYELPEELIAQYPAEPRDQSRLLIVDRASGMLEDRIFRDVIDYLQAGDTLVLNDTRVIPARLLGYKKTGAKVEILLLKKNGSAWEALVKPARRLNPGDRVYFQNDQDTFAEITRVLPVAGGRLITFHNCPNEEEFLQSMGHIPLPPYISRADEAADVNRYQTVYARRSGSAAAPTAGLHFTEELLFRIREKGVNLAPILLHVGLGTFRPVSSSDIRCHKMHSEYYQIDENTARILNTTRSQGKKIVAVGTTVVRTLETVYKKEYGFRAGEGFTDIFIYPGFEFQSVDHILTNFHLPGSSLIMLVAAFAGLENILAAYQHAVTEKYRFFSYGDAMLVR